MRDGWFSEISKLLMEQQNSIKGKVTLVDFSLESYAVSSFVVGVQVGDSVQENNLPGKELWPHFHSTWKHLCFL